MTASTGDVTATMVGFARTVRAAGVAAGPERVQALVVALDHVDVLRRDAVYWAGRVTLCASHDDLARYDRAFAAYFAGVRPTRLRTSFPSLPPAEEWRPAASARPSYDDRAAEDADHAAAAVTASELEVLRQRDIALLDAAERKQLHRLLALLDAPAPARPSRRHQPAHHGSIDVHRTVRATLRYGGETPRLLHRRRRVRPRRVVLLVDVSGSMAPYADALLRFAHAAVRRRRATEVFTIGTRLTRVTRELRQRDPDAALRAVAGAVPDWSGGTRLGELIKAFLARWGRRGMARGAIVVVASDGWERGDPTMLGEQLAQLRLLAHRVVWANPHRARPGYQPLTAGMAAALPYVDDFVDGHSLDALERLAALVSAAGNASGSRRA
ncbi:MAG: VWA domain-containing protein [Actinomycetota bacterium]|jgi:uncharacterized protein with von Willebrand factor type A (vWA) domain|nr:VWA domain-containing protein [Acidothermales bacterium]MDQ3431203.1 VWA domain-containing protein [Actinomycetota bacterium]